MITARLEAIVLNLIGALLVVVELIVKTLRSIMFRSDWGSGPVD